LTLELGFHPISVESLVGLRPWRPDGGAATAIQQLELNTGGVDSTPHQAAQRIDFAYEMPLGRAADRRVARHVRDGILRQRTEPNMRAKACRRVRRLAACVPRTDDDHVEAVFHVTTINADPRPKNDPDRGATRGFSFSSLADAEPREDVLEQVLRRTASADRLERGARFAEICEHELFRE
jgi:hypothetical protein